MLQTADLTIAIDASALSQHHGLESGAGVPFAILKIAFLNSLAPYSITAFVAPSIVMAFGDDLTVDQLRRAT